MQKYIILIILFFVYPIFGQVGINTNQPDPSAYLDAVSSNKGILIPKIKILGRNDIITIPNPAKGLMIICDNDAGTGSNKVFKDRVYYFNGSTWDELLENNNNGADFLFPKVAAVGRKTTTNTSCTGLKHSTFALNIITNKDGNILASTGALTASKTGYYSWSIQLEQIMKKNAYSPYILPGNYSYEFRKDNTLSPGTSTSQYTVFSGSVYLMQGQTSSPFEWRLGDGNLDVCSVTDYIGKQVVVWKYLGE